MTDKEIFAQYWGSNAARKEFDFTLLPERYQPVVRKCQAVLNRFEAYKNTPDFEQHLSVYKQHAAQWHEKKINGEEFENRVKSLTDDNLCELIEDLTAECLKSFPAIPLTVKVSKQLFCCYPLGDEFDPKEAFDAAFTLIIFREVLARCRVTFNPMRVPSFKKLGEDFQSAIMAS